MEAGLVMLVNACATAAARNTRFNIITCTIQNMCTSLYHLPSFVGKPAVTKVTNAASPRSFAAAKAASIRPLCPLAIDDDIFANCVVFKDGDLVLFKLLAARKVAAGIAVVREEIRCSMEAVFLTATASSGMRRRCI